jgi:site-specific DNA-cytosine methylase
MVNRSGGRVNSTKGCAPTILSRDFKQPKMIMEEVKIAAMRGRNPDNPSERGKNNGNYQQRLEVNENGMRNTLTSVQKDNLVIEPTEDTATTICLNSKVDDKQPSVADRIYDTNGIAVALTSGWKQNIAEVLQVGNLIDDTDRNFKNPQTGRVYSVQGLAPTINTCQGGNREPKIIDQPRYRIRKLTPRECFRLMGCDEETIDIIQAAGISNSQQYKLAGNSIVVACLEKIFEQMLFPQYTNSRTLFG